MQDALPSIRTVQRLSPDERMVLTRRQLAKSQHLLERTQHHLAEIRKSLDTYKRISVRSQMIG